MDITRSGSSPSAPGPSDSFTGRVRVDAPFSGGGALSSATVTFEPGARTAWHTHPMGQTILILSGLGRVQREGGPVEEVRAGDIVFFEAQEKHWHGASPTCAMSHLAVAPVRDGQAVDWLEQVSDADYAGDALMSAEQTAAQKLCGDVAPALADRSDRALFGEVWERPGLSKRHHSLATMTALIASYRVMNDREALTGLVRP